MVILHKLSDPYSRQHTLEIKMNYHDFLRIITKIGYCHAVAVFGLDGMSWMVGEHIRGKEIYMGSDYFTGSDFHTTTEDRNYRHKVSCAIAVVKDRGFMIRCTIELFANLGFPIYETWVPLL